MKVLSDAKLVSFLKDITEVIPEKEFLGDDFFVCPEGMSKEQTMLLTRILQAKKPEELSDIPTEKIIDLWAHVPSYAKCIGSSSIFDKKSFYRELIGFPSAKKSRRIL